EAPDLHGYQPLHRRAGRSGPHPPVRPADRAFQRVRQLFDVQRLRPAGHPARRYGAVLQPGAPCGEPKGLLVSPL
ncbi:Phage holin, partial [Dysosmobacter welbionis]